ncbi:hypothetical protein Bca52824_029202 [Brassica carinata]|uniref:Leucine-rich repeat-containing N-terminal plant-type domain-containing protein n=1 Tax=Brassica carinata TaxID=52824 RepID=A0A8X7VE41_BRACI|nr:hypothetical protein Bca52824_029202 [Brassica carinata]
MAFWFVSVLLIVGFLSKSELVEAQLSDEAAVLAIHRELGVPGWSSNGTDYCNWVRLKCGANNSFVEMLDLSGLQLKVEFGKLRGLRSLNVSNNLLVGEIPDELMVLERLEEFQVSGNGLNGSIPHWVGNLSNLRVFTAYENEFLFNF